MCTLLVIGNKRIIYIIFYQMKERDFCSILLPIFYHLLPIFHFLMRYSALFTRSTKANFSFWIFTRLSLQFCNLENIWQNSSRNPFMDQMKLIKPFLYYSGITLVLLYNRDFKIAHTLLIITKTILTPFAFFCYNSKTDLVMGPFLQNFKIKFHYKFDTSL